MSNLTPEVTRSTDEPRIGLFGIMLIAFGLILVIAQAVTWAERVRELERQVQRLERRCQP